MVDYLDIALGLYEPTIPGELKGDKMIEFQRNWDENVAFLTFSNMVGVIYGGPGDQGNIVGQQRLKDYRSEFLWVPPHDAITDLTNNQARAATILEQLRNFQSGTSVDRTFYPYITIFCTDEDIFSETNLQGQTFAEG